METPSCTTPVLAVGASFPALGAVQSLGRRGVPCWVCAPSRGVAAVSRYARYRRIPDPLDDDRGAVDGLLALVRELPGRPILMPADDEYAQVVGRFEEELGGVATICGAGERVVELLLDKGRFFEWASEHSLSAPRMLRASAVVPSVGLRFPWVVKSVRHTRSMDYTGSDADYVRFELVHDMGEWEELRARHADALDDLLVQEYVRGTTEDMFSIGVYADRSSKLRGVFVARKLRGYPAAYGNAAAGQNDVVPRRVLDEVSRVVTELGFTGVAEVEYKRDVATGEFALIEVNPRCWSWMCVTTDSPADIPWIAYRDLCGDPLPYAEYNADPGAIKYVRVLRDLPAVVFECRWTHPAWSMSPVGWWRSLAAERLVLEEFGRGDWPVAAWNLLRIPYAAVRFALRRVRGRFRRRAGGAPVARARGEAERGMAGEKGYEQAL